MDAHICICYKNKEEVIHLKEEEGGTRRVGRRERDGWDDLSVTYVGFL